MKNTKQLLLVILLQSGVFLLPAQSYTIEFEVNQNPPLSAGIQTKTIAKNIYRLETGITGGYPGYTCRWSPETGLDNPSSASPILYMSRAADSYQLEITDSKGCTLIVHYSPVTSIADVQAEKPEFQTGFNPESRQLQIRFAVPVPEAEITIYNIQGQKTGYCPVKNIPAASTLSLAIPKQEAGIYLVQVKTGSFQQTKKIVIQ